MIVKTYLVTGGAGFIGSNFVLYMLAKYDDVKIVNLDKLTYAGNLENLKDVENNPNHIFVQGDICDKEPVSYTHLPLPPPIGRPVREFLKICSKPRNLMMPRLTDGWKRKPPL